MVHKSATCSFAITLANVIQLLLSHSQMNCIKSLIKFTNSPQNCCCNTLDKSILHLCDFAASYSIHWPHGTELCQKCVIAYWVCVNKNVEPRVFTVTAAAATAATSVWNQTAEGHSIHSWLQVSDATPLLITWLFHRYTALRWWSERCYKQYAVTFTSLHYIPISDCSDSRGARRFFSYAAPAIWNSLSANVLLSASGFTKDASVWLPVWCSAKCDYYLCQELLSSRESVGWLVSLFVKIVVISWKLHCIKH